MKSPAHQLDQNGGLETDMIMHSQYKIDPTFYLIWSILLLFDQNTSDVKTVTLCFARNLLTQQSHSGITLALTFCVGVEHHNAPRTQCGVCCYVIISNC